MRACDPEWTSVPGADDGGGPAEIDLCLVCLSPDGARVENLESEATEW